MQINRKLIRRIVVVLSLFGVIVMTCFVLAAVMVRQVPTFYSELLHSEEPASTRAELEKISLEFQQWAKKVSLKSEEQLPARPDEYVLRLADRHVNLLLRNADTASLSDVRICLGDGYASIGLKGSFAKQRAIYSADLKPIPNSDPPTIEIRNFRIGLLPFPLRRWLRKTNFNFSNVMLDLDATGPVPVLTVDVPASNRIRDIEVKEGLLKVRYGREKSDMGQ